MRTFWVFIALFLIFIIACDKKKTTAPVEPGFVLEQAEPDKLNAYPILGYMQTDSKIVPTIDGKVAENDIWQLAPAYDIKTEIDKQPLIVNMKALYDNSYIYFLVNWEELTKNSGEEGGFSIIWNYSSSDFISCSNLCHAATSMATDYRDSVDVWQWNSNELDSVETMSDRYLANDGFHDDETRGKDDILAKGIYDNGKWTLELRRRLKTNVNLVGVDVEFNPNTDANIDFHIAVFDSSHGKDHAITTKVHVLHFLQLNLKDN